MSNGEEARRCASAEDRSMPRALLRGMWALWYVAVVGNVVLGLVDGWGSALWRGACGFLWSVTLWHVCVHSYYESFHRSFSDAGHKRSLLGWCVAKWVVLALGGYGMWHVSAGEVSLQLAISLLGALLGFVAFVAVVLAQRLA